MYNSYKNVVKETQVLRNCSLPNAFIHSSPKYKLIENTQNTTSAHQTTSDLSNLKNSKVSNLKKTFLAFFSKPHCLSMN